MILKVSLCMHLWIYVQIELKNLMRKVVGVRLMNK